MITHYYRQFKKFKFFLGKEVWGLFIAAFFIGLFWFGVESSFIFVLQSFLTAIGLVDAKNTFLPSFFPTQITGAILTLMAFGLLRSIAILLRQFSSEITTQAFVRIQRERIIEFALSQTAEVSTHDVLNAFNEQIPVASQVISGVSLSINVGIACFCMFILGLRLAPLELGLGMSALFTLFISMKFINSKIDVLGKKVFSETKKLSHTLILGLKNHFLLKVYGLTAREVERGRNAASAYEHFYKRYIFMASLKSAFPQFAGSVVVCLVCFVSTKYIHTSSAKLISFIYIFMRLAQGLSDGSAIVLNIRFKWETFKELFQWHLRSEDFILHKAPELEMIGRSESPFLREKISLNAKELSFGYPNEKDLLSNINLSVAQGDILLLKGPSGSGKSTLLTLLLGLQKPTTGSVNVNGKEVIQIRNELASLIAYVGPEPYLIQGSIRENLSYVNTLSNLTDADYWKALEQAQLSDLVRKNEKGLDWELKEVTELSTGQKQRLSMARALLRKPKIFVLDEGTANLDPATEKEIISVIQEISHEMSIIVVSHKDSFDSIATQVIDLGRAKK